MDTLKAYWEFLVAAGGALVWLVRLEAKTVFNGRDISRLWDQRKTDNDDIKALIRETKSEIAGLRQDLIDFFKQRGKE